MTPLGVPAPRADWAYFFDIDGTLLQTDYVTVPAIQEIGDRQQLQPRMRPPW